MTPLQAAKDPSLKSMMQMKIGIEERVRAISESLPEKDGALIPLLQRVQADQGYLSPSTVKAVAEELGLSESSVYGVATFYAEFKLLKPGRHHIKVCLGTSCYLRGGRDLLGHLCRRLGIDPGSTSKDGKFSLETVACLGCCSRSPTMAINDIIYGDLTASEADSILAGLD
jgi:NADH-quinone oxidoreductase subunit E